MEEKIMKIIPLVILGCGGVGRQLLQHIVSCRSLHAKQGVCLRVLAVSDSKSLIMASPLSNSELHDNVLLEICHIKAAGSLISTINELASGCRIYSCSEVERELIQTALLLGKSTGLTYVDCSASSETLSLLNEVVDLGCYVVLANKKPLTSTLELYDKLTSRPRHIRHESTVGAGLPVISSLNRIISSGDDIHRIVASLSGTLGYVMSEIEEGKALSEVVRVARSLGYTEPDPRDDLSGMDVARKALILARLLGIRINLDGVKIDNLCPIKMDARRMTIEEFLGHGIALLDNDIRERVQKASLRGYVLRYVCVIESSRCEVGIQEVPKNSPLGRLRGSDNVVEIYSRCYNEQPLVIQGAGAGNDTTAAAVLADILDLQDLFSSKNNSF